MLSVKHRPETTRPPSRRQRSGELRRSRQLGVHDLVDGEARSTQRVQRRSVAVTAHEEPVEPVHPVLHPGHPLVGGPQVLDEQEPAGWPQHPMQLSGGAALVVHGAQGQRGHHDVERRGVEGQVLRGRAEHGGGRRDLLGPAPEAFEHRGSGSTTVRLSKADP
jgi:hypothetical protein